MRMIVRLLVLSVSAIALFACAKSEIIQISRNQVMISTTAAPVCGIGGSYRVSQQMAAVATIRHGFERYILGGASSSNTYFKPTETTLLGKNNTQLQVSMLNPGDAGYENGLDPKAILGPDWQKKVKDGITTCSK